MTAAGTLVDRVGEMLDRLNAGGLDGYLAGYAPTVVPHGYPQGVTDFQSLSGYYRTLMGAVDDVRVELEHTVEQGDLVAVRFCLKARHTGELLGAPATGKELQLRGATFLRFEDGRVVERWQHADDLGLLQQLGLVPTG